MLEPILSRRARLGAAQPQAGVRAPQDRRGGGHLHGTGRVHLHSPHLSRRGFLIAAGATALGIGAIALDPFGGDGSATPTVHALPARRRHPIPPRTDSRRSSDADASMDPASGFDAVADVGIDGGTVARDRDDGRAHRRVDDRRRGAGRRAGLHRHPQLRAEPVRHLVQGGRRRHDEPRPPRAPARASDFFAAYATDALRPPTHYGGAFSDPFTRESLGLGVDDAASAKQIDTMVAQCDEDLRNGYIAVDFEPEYTPGVQYDEIKALAEVAKDHDVPATFHARFSDDVAPGTNAEALAEVLRVARDTGAHVHVEHIISTGGTYTMQQSLDTLEAARRDGVEVTACTYPYDYWATYLASTRFNEGWQDRFHISYHDLADRREW